MKVTCKRAELLAACQGVASCVEPSAAKLNPTLANIKLVADARDDGFVIMAADKEVGVRIEMSGIEIQQNGDGLILASKLLNILRECTDESVTIHVRDDATIISTGGSRYKLATEDAAKFPNVHTFGDEDYNTVDSSVLKRLLPRASICLGKIDDDKCIATGMLFAFDSGTLRLVSCDGKRVSYCFGNATVRRDSKDSFPSIVPTKAVRILDKLLPLASSVQIALGSNDAAFKVGPATIRSRLLAGKFIKYQKTFSMPTDLAIEIDGGFFASKVRQAAIMTDAISQKINFDIQAGVVEMTAADAIGSGCVEMPIPDYTGIEYLTAFDPSLLTDALRFADGNVTLKIGGNTLAILEISEDFQYFLAQMNPSKSQSS